MANPINQAMKIAGKPAGLLLLLLGVVLAVMVKPVYLQVAKVINPKILEEG